MWRPMTENVSAVFALATFRESLSNKKNPTIPEERSAACVCRRTVFRWSRARPGVFRLPPLRETVPRCTLADCRCERAWPSFGPRGAPRLALNDPLIKAGPPLSGADCVAGVRGHLQGCWWPEFLLRANCSPIYTS